MRQPRRAAAGGLPVVGHGVTPWSAPPRRPCWPSARSSRPARQLARFRVAPPRVRLGPRALPTAVLSPVTPPAAAASGRLARGLFPLVVFAPGFAQCAVNYGSLLHAWASAGYVVAGVDFPRSNCHLTNPTENDLVNQPADMAYVIRRLLAVPRGAPRFLARPVDPRQIAAAGP